MSSRPPDPGHLRPVLSAFPTGVTAVAATIDGTPLGLAANSFTSVSLDPPMVSICIAHTSTTWPLLRPARRSSAWLDCSIEQETRAGDHDIILLRVHDLDADHAIAPLVFHGSQFRQLQGPAQQSSAA